MPNQQKKIPWCGDWAIAKAWAFQAGLSWRTVLHKRESFREVFHDFVPASVARMPAREIARAVRNPGIIRNRQKILATVANARAFLALQKKWVKELQ